MCVSESGELGTWVEGGRECGEGVEEMDEFVFAKAYERWWGESE